MSKDEKCFAVEYAGWWRIQSAPHYGAPDILNAEDVGEKQAEENANKIVDLLNGASQFPSQGLREALEMVDELCEKYPCALAETLKPIATEALKK